MSGTVKIRKGKVLVYRIFDIAEEINMHLAESILRNPKGSFPFKVPKYIDRALVVKSLPAAFELGEIELGLDCGTYKVDVVGKIRDYGVLSLVYQIRVPEGTSWDDLVRLASDLEEGTDIDPIAIAQAKVVCEQLAPALKQASDWKVFEDYVVYFCEEFEGNTTAANLLERADIPALLLAEDDSGISQKVRGNILENIYQYSTDDMAVVEWNSALVVEPKGGMEVPEIIEFALTHLLEMRYYDDLLDKRLAFLYDDIERSKGNMLRGRFSQIYQDASSRYIEFSEFIERVENSLKVVGDFYLATVYRAATRRFRLADWQQNVTRKMNLLAQVSSLLQGEVNMRRSHWMEITIILLIAFEIVSALLKLN